MKAVRKSMIGSRFTYVEQKAGLGRNADPAFWAYMQAESVFYKFLVIKWVQYFFVVILQLCRIANESHILYTID